MTVLTDTVSLAACPACGQSSLRTLSEPVARRIFATDGPDMTARIGVSACASCGLVFLNPRLSTASLRAYYARQSRMPRAAVPNDSPIARMIDCQLDFIRAAKTLDAQSAVLEIGCAEGYLLERLGNRVPGITRAAIEPSARYAQSARERLPDARITEDMLHECSERIGSFDLVVMRHVLEHLSQPMADLVLVRRLLRTSGAVYIEVPDAARIPPAVCHYFHHEHLTYFSRETLVALLARAGLGVLAVEAYAGYEPGSGFSYPVLRALASACDAGTPQNYPEQPDQIWRHFRENEERFLRAYLESARAKLDAAAREGRRLALFGAGPHTVDLLDRLEPARYDWVVVFDNHPGKAGKRLCGIPIAVPTRQSLATVDTVFVSSLEYESEMIDQLHALAGARIEVIPLYTAAEFV